MVRSAFLPADILLPADADMEDWSVIACDQYTSERDYWDRVAERTRGKLSTFHMVLPEAYLGDAPLREVAQSASGVMESYLTAGVFDTIKDSFVYVERAVTGGVRRGLVGAIDLDAYDYSPVSGAAVRASERTVVERLPARVQIRESAPLELPHIMALIDDPKKSVIEPLRKKTGSMRKLYDFELLEGGGRIKGYQVDGELAAAVTASLETLFSGRGVQIIVGDGNHSLAAAKDLWEKKKRSLTESEAENSPARYALAELCNVYDDGVRFEPIHRIVFNTDPEKLMEVMKEKLSCRDGHAITCVCGGKNAGSIPVRGKSFAGMLESLQDFLEEYAVLSGGNIDYIHDESSLVKLTKEKGSVGFLLPAMDKSEFFSTVISNGVFPKKCFSIGFSRDKRYYLECRKIK